MPSYNMNDYVSVAERVNAAQDKIQAVTADPPAFLTETMGYIRVAILLNDGRSATGTASFRLDLQGKGAQATNPIEDCETSAIGRALAFLGYASSKSIASKEEVQEAQRREASYTPPAPRQPARPAPAKSFVMPEAKLPEPPANGERPMVKRLRELVNDCRGAGVAVPSLPKPKDMTDEQLFAAITDLEIEYSKAQQAAEKAEDLL